MKKFMTVLLVIAVMFTFSFGSAFAFEAGTAPDTISDGYFETLWADYVKAAKDYEGFEISKSVLAGMKAEAKVVYDAAMAEAEAYVTTAEGFAAVFTANNTKANAFRLAAAAAQFAADKDAALAKFATVPTYNYSAEEIAEDMEATVKAITGKDADDKTYQEVAEMLVAAYVEAVEDCDDFNADVTVADYKAASVAAKKVVTDELFAMAYRVGAEVSLTGAYDLVDAYAHKSGTTAEGVNFVDQDAVNNWSVEAIAAQGQVNAAGVAAKKAENAAKYAAFVVGKDAATVKMAAKWLKIADILAEEGVEAVLNADTLDEYAVKADQIAKLEAFAAKHGAEKNAEGELVRDAAVVKVELEKGIVAIAKAADKAAAVVAEEDAEEAIEAAKSAVVAEKLAFVKESAVKATELFLADAAEDEVYFAAEYAKVEAKVAEYVAKIEAAKEFADVEAAIEAMQDKVDDIKTAEEIRTLCTTGTLSGTVTDLVNYAKAYVAYYETGKTEGNQLDESTLAAKIVEMVGESGLRTVAEVKKLTEEATAVAQGLPTNDEVKAAKKAVKAAVEAIPTKVTVEDLALVQAAAAAQEAFEEMTTADSTYTDEITAAVEKLVAAYNTSFVKAAATVAKTDEAAVKALKAEIKAVINTLEDLGATTTYLNGLVATLNGYLADIKADELDAIKAAVKAIPLNVTEADKAVVEKARELVDAYEAKYTDITALYYQDDATMGNTKYYAGYVALNFTDLTEAETILGLNVEDEAYSVEALKITAKSSVKKGSITVKWSVVGDTDAVEGYEVFRSVKKNSGFGTKPFYTTTKTSYKNTKNLKAGTRYFFKVRAFATTEEGVKVYSDWSNKAYRVAK